MVPGTEMPAEGGQDGGQQKVSKHRSAECRGPGAGKKAPLFGEARAGAQGEGVSGDSGAERSEASVLGA